MVAGIVHLGLGQGRRAILGPHPLLSETSIPFPLRGVYLRDRGRVPCLGSRAGHAHSPSPSHSRPACHDSATAKLSLHTRCSTTTLPIHLPSLDNSMPQLSQNNFYPLHCQCHCG
jgi:hypothetical protein